MRRSRCKNIHLVYISIHASKRLRRYYLVSKCFPKTLVGRRWCTLVHIFQTISIVTSSKQTRRLFNFYSAIDVAVIPTTISNCCQSIHCWCRIVLNFCMYLRSIALCRTDSDLVETQILLKNLSSIQGEGKNTYIISFKWGDNRGGLFVNVPSICIVCSKNTCWSNKTFFLLCTTSFIYL